MNLLEKRILNFLKQSVKEKNDAVIFAEMGYIVDAAYEEGFLSSEWKSVYQQYCSENQPSTDDFSYLDLMDRIYEKFKDNL